MNTLGRSRALIVDDQPLVVIEIEDILVERGFEVVSVSTRAHLERALEAGPYAVIVTDTDLATLDEIEGWRAGKVIICSGKPRGTLEADYPGLAIVEKPFTAADLISLLPVS